jgi:nucleoid-associated protein YgaU
MKLEEKYGELVRTARSAGVTNLQVREQDNVLYIDGDAPSEAVKKQLWDIYGRLDPDYRAGDVVMNIEVSGQQAAQQYEVMKGDNLSKIGKRFGVSWQEIYEANKDQIKDPDLIQPGWKLKIPQKVN